MIITAKLGGQCWACQREIHAGDLVAEDGKFGQVHFDPGCDEVKGRRVGSAACVEPDWRTCPRDPR